MLKPFDTVDAAEARLNELHRQHAEGTLSLNHEGREAVLKMFEPGVVRNDILERLRTVTEQRWRRPPERLSVGLRRRPQGAQGAVPRGSSVEVVMGTAG